MAGICVKIVDGIVRDHDGTWIDKVELRAVDGLRDDTFSLRTEGFKITVPLKTVEEAVKKARKSK